MNRFLRIHKGLVPYVGKELEVLVEEQVRKKHGGHAQIRTAELGADPRTRRAQLRATMQPGFYLLKVKTLPMLGSCYALPGVDYLQFEYLGLSFPPVASFDIICRSCGRNIDNPDEDSDVPFTSSSSFEEQQ